MQDDVSRRVLATSAHTWPIAMEAIGPVSCGAMVWKLGQKARVTVIVSATFELQPGGPMQTVLAEPIAVADVPHSTGTSTYISTDLVPFRKRADVVLTGYACAPACAETRAVIARLLVFRDKLLLDKTVHVFGDERGQKPFEKMPLIYERAWGGPSVGDNPVGTGATQGSAAPNLVHPATLSRVACFGPLHPSWPIRAHYLEGLEPDALSGPTLSLPTTFDMSYFQSAPADQQIEYLHGDEWIVLDGVTPMLPRYLSQLPMAHAQARIWGHAQLREGQPLDLVADTLRIDAGRMLCTVVWRAGFPLASEESRWRLRVIAGIETKDIKLSWPSAWKIAEREHPLPPRTPFVARPPTLRARRGSSVPPPPASRPSWTTLAAPEPTQQAPSAAPVQPIAPPPSAREAEEAPPAVLDDALAEPVYVQSAVASAPVLAPPPPADLIPAMAPPPLIPAMVSSFPSEVTGEGGKKAE